MSDASTPLILFPGMGADARMFAPLRSDLPQLVTPDWIEPERGESLVAYARRLAKIIDPGRPCFVGGASFGGVVALEVAAILPSARACFLIGSMRTPDGLPLRLRVLRPLTPLIGLLPLFSWLIPPLVGSALGSRARRVVSQFTSTDARFLRWATRAVMNWKPSPGVAQVRVLQIHGGLDRVFPIQRAQPDCVVSEAGHALSITHPNATTTFLQSAMESELRSVPTTWP